MNITRPLKKIKRLLSLKYSHKLHKIATETHGSEYGKWVIPSNILDENSVCFLAGAGEDISFDTEIAEIYGCRVFIFDPTPRAKMHYNKLCEYTEKGKKLTIDNNYQYNISKENIKNLRFVDVGLWDKKEVLKFYEPANSEHVSHSALNLQKTEKYFEAEVNSLSNLMETYGYHQIDLLKLDIEGSEYKVIETIVKEQPTIKILCIEFDEAHLPLDDKYIERINNAVEQLKSVGFMIVDIDKNFNFSFIHKNYI